MFIYEKGYQSIDTAVGSTFTKMKGVGYTNVYGHERVWDVSDYVFPDQVGDWLGTRIYMWNVRRRMVYVDETDRMTEHNID